MGRKRRSAYREIPVDPFWMSRVNDGYLSNRLLHEDVYFDEGQPDPAAELFDDLLAELPEDERACVEMRALGGYSFSAIARELDWYCGDPPYPNRKRAWRITQSGLERLRAWLGDVGNVPKCGIEEA